MHTKGPWKVIRLTDMCYGIDSAADYSVVEFDMFGEFGIHNQCDARLIAAAPDLLDACKRSYKRLRVIYDGPEIEELEAAIKKATGE